MKNVLFLFFVIECFCLNLSAQSSCQNIDFENGDFSGWVSTGDVQMVNRGQLDLYGNFQLATSGFFAVKLGRTEESHVSTIKRSIYIDNSTQYFIYSYAVVLSGANHTEEEAARVELNIIDSSGQVIPCTHFEAIARPSVIDGFVASDSMNMGFPIFYKPWVTNAVDLSPYIGQTLTIEITNRWCIYDVHFGYSYIDTYCTSQLINSFSNCADQNYYIRTIDGFEEYVWNGPGIVNGAGTNLVQVNQPGLYTVDIPNPNPTCDSVHLEIEVTLNEVPDIPVVNFSWSSVCLGDTSTLYGNVSTINPIQDQTWAVNGVEVGSNFSEQLILNAESPYAITYTVTNESGCSDSVTKILSIHQAPDLEIGDDQKICPGEVVKLSNLVNADAELTWSTGEVGPFIEVSSEGIYSVTAFNGYCKSVDTAHVSMGNMHLGKIPNIITPNKDLINDELIIEANLQEYHLEITNRWGNPVFTTDNPALYWDGTSNGNLVDDGVYYYILEFSCEGIKLKKNGFVQVQR